MAKSGMIAYSSHPTFRFLCQPGGHFRLLLLCVVSWFGTASLRASEDHYLRLLPDHQEALQFRIDLIEQAEHEIDCSYYLVDTGRVSASILRLLIDAAHRGVRVRLLIDGLMSRLPEPLHRILRENGVEIHAYRFPESVHPRTLNQRMHDKLLIVDRKHLILGSRNLRDNHFGIGESPFLDCDLYIQGPVAGQAAAYYQWLWQHEQVKPLSQANLLGRMVTTALPLRQDPWVPAFKAAKTDQQYLQLLDRSYMFLIKHGFIGTRSIDTSKALPVAGNRVEFFAETDVAKSNFHVQKRLLNLIHQAQQTVLIQTPYPIFNERDLLAIYDARQRNVDVILCTNSINSADRAITSAGFENIKDDLLSAGVKIYQLQSKPHLHTKAMVIDGQIGVVSSYNFDERSAALNLEVGMIVQDAHFTESLLAVIAEQMAGAQLATVATLLQPAADAVQSRRYWKVQFNRLLAPWIRPLL